ncbi:MAG: hypothetical protein IKY52_09740, partial [Clostridia bacterium]|nr:hypothetical protein [Clostridia bacterium]
IHISKADFWKADGRIHVQDNLYGGLAPLGMVEILLPQLAYADYKVEQNLDDAYIELHLTAGKMTANLKITVCAEENTILLALDRTHPAVSASIALIPLEGAEAEVSSGYDREVQYAARGFHTPECKFPTYGICVMKQISRTVDDGREHILWAIHVCTNHDSAAYRTQAIEKVRAMNENDCRRLYRKHDEWWKCFWSKSSVELPDEKLELYWYASLYAVACCMRNKNFPGGIWGAYATADGMGFCGDYHMNYNYQAPFYALTSSNHTELLEPYSAPLNQFLPIGRQYAREFLGIEGFFLPCGVGPYGMETYYNPLVKEHGHLFHGQKSNSIYAAVIPMMHWYGTRDTEFAKREYYEFLLSVAEFWENYLVFEDDAYHIYNDALNEVGWYEGPDHMPYGHDDKDPIVSKNLIRMLMKLMIDLSGTLGMDTERIHKWQHILDHLPDDDTFESEGESILRGISGSEEVRELALEAMFPAGQIGKYTTPELFQAAKNTHKRLGIWDSHNRFCSYYPMAARLEYPAEEITAHIHDVIENRGMPNGMFRYGGGGLENSSAVPSTVNEMLLQSYEGIIRLFPVWNQDARFHGLRAYGAFVIDASQENGTMYAEIFSEKGMPLTLETPGSGYVLIRGDGTKLPLQEKFITVATQTGERLILTQDTVIL